jgi:hypothetical protein
MELFNIMSKDDISPPEKIEQLGKELAAFYENKKFLKARTMGDLVKLNLKQTLRKNMKALLMSKTKSIY